MTFRDDLRLARALYQLTIYLESCRVPFTLQDFYLKAYGELWEEMPGARWLEHLGEDRAVVVAKDEYYTLKTVFDTLHDHELNLLLEVIYEETAKLGIGMGVVSPGHYRRRDHRDPDPSSE